MRESLAVASNGPAVLDAAGAFESMAAAFAEAARTRSALVSTSHYSFAGRLARATVVGRGLSRALERPFAHLLQREPPEVAAQLQLELWEEAAEEGGTNPWLEEMTRLFDRLNPDIEFEPWNPEEIEQQGGGPVGLCAFCDRPVNRDELFGMNLHDYTDRMSFSQGLWLHLPCLNARLHHKHAVANLKFDPDNLPDLDKL